MRAGKPPDEELEGVPSAAMPQAAVILMAYGSPDRLADVPAYYADIRGGRSIRPELLDELVERYRRLGIEDENPLNAITEEVRAALERELSPHARVFTGMKHWRPRIADAVEAALATGVETLVGLVLAPHYSRLSIGGYRDQLDEVLGDRAACFFVESWHTEPAFVELLAERVRAVRAEAAAHVVFTAHSLPARILAEGDPYQEQLLETSRLVADAAPVESWSFSYQSQSATGEPWLGPDIVDHLADLASGGIDHVVVCPVGFVSDHLEIRWDLDIIASEAARSLGLELRRIEMPNADAEFVRVLGGIVRRELRVPSAA